MVALLLHTHEQEFSSLAEFLNTLNLHHCGPNCAAGRGEMLQ